MQKKALLRRRYLYLHRNDTPQTATPTITACNTRCLGQERQSICRRRTPHGFLKNSCRKEMETQSVDSHAQEKNLGKSQSQKQGRMCRSPRSSHYCGNVGGVGNLKSSYVEKTTREIYDEQGGFRESPSLTTSLSGT